MADRMTDARLREIEALAERATKGPWSEAINMSREMFGVISDSGEVVCESKDAKDMAFIAASRTAVPDMAEEIRAAWKENEALRNGGHFNALEMAMILGTVADAKRIRALEEKLNGVTPEELVNGFVRHVEAKTGEPYTDAHILTGTDYTRYQGLDAENASLRAQLEAAKIPDAVLKAIENVKQAVSYGGRREMSDAGGELWQAWDEWHGPCSENTPEGAEGGEKG